MNPIGPSSPSLPRRVPAWPSALALAALLAACAAQPPASAPRDPIPAGEAPDLAAAGPDSAAAASPFYGKAFEAYQAGFPSADAPSFMAVAEGKDSSFCLFQPDPGRACADSGDRFKALGLGGPARDAYEAGLLSESANGEALNVRLWTGMAEAHFGLADPGQAMPYVRKVIEAGWRNRQAKRSLKSAPREASAAGGARKPGAARKAARGQAPI